MSKNKVLESFGEESVKQIQDNMRRAKQVATGDTLRDIKYEFLSDNRMQISGPAHVMALEKGRGPYKGGPKGSPPLYNKLLRWAQAKGLIINVSAVYKKIQNEGTSLFRRGGRKDIITPVFSEDRIKDLEKDLADDFFKVANTNLFDGIND